MAGALRVFVITWDPIEHRAPRPDAIAAVNAGSLGLEIAVYVPLWRLTALAAARSEPLAATLSAIAGSAVVTAAAQEKEVTAGRYPALLASGEVPDLLADLSAGAALGPATTAGEPPSWEPIGLGAIQDVIQHAFGPVDLDRSQVELPVISPAQRSCPACGGQRFGFPADLGQSQELMCSEHASHAGKVISERLDRAERSNPEGWQALQEATIRQGRPHLPDGLATRLAGGDDIMYVEPEPDELAELARLTLEAAAWFPGQGDDFGVALGEDPKWGGWPDWLHNLPLFLGRGGLPAEAVSVTEALISVSPDRRSALDADLAVALAEAGDADAARAKVAANLQAWPDDYEVRLLAGDALEALGDLDGAHAHFEAALDITEDEDLFEERSDVIERLMALSRKQRRVTARRVQRAGKKSRSARRRRP